MRRVFTEKKIDIVMLRFFTVFGPKQRPDLAIYKFTKLIDEGKAISFFGNGERSRDYTFVQDIVDGILLLSNYVERTYADLTKIKNLVGYAPKNTLKQGVEKFVKWYFEKVKK